jgi:outer membrane protein assembly factor BamA
MGQVGAATDFRLDTRDQPRAPIKGFAANVGGSFYPAALDVTSAFGELHGEAASHLTASIPLRPTLALRVGGKKVWGTYPFHEAAYVGGATTVRGFPEHRFAGDASLYGNVELRFSLFKFFLLLPAQLGLFGLGDAGRVWLTGETSDRWHGAAGGGVWIAFISRSNTLSVCGARSVEGTSLYARAGFAF